MKYKVKLEYRVRDTFIVEATSESEAESKAMELIHIGGHNAEHRDTSITQADDKAEIDG